MPYDQARTQEQRAKLEAATGEFITRYNAKPAGPPRKTIFLFPGGLGSRLVRAGTPHQEGATQSFHYSTVWLDCSILFGAALDLQMQNDIDSARRIIVADGYVQFDLLDIKPYEQFIEWCDLNGLDWFVFGWDWRRRVDHAVDLFLNFLPTFRQRVQDACNNADPLADFTLVGHSFGGMLVKLILNRQDPLANTCSQAVSVGTPFYGHGAHAHRYFAGDPYLNFEGKAKITRAVSSMRGGYALLFLDQATFNRDGPALAADPDFPLTGYPSMDANDATELADPYNPTPKGGKVRYPGNFRFNVHELQVGLQTYQDVAAPLPAATNAKFFNIRGVQARNGVPVNGTVSCQTWKRIPNGFNPDVDQDPITDVTMGPGDGVIPAWSARLVSAPPQNVRTLTGDIEHMTMMSANETHLELMRILGMAPVRRRRRRRPKRAETASPADINAFVEGLRVIRASDKVDQVPDILRYLSKFTAAELRSLMSTAFIDALKSPSQKFGEPGKPRARPTRKRSGGARKGKKGRRPKRAR